MRKPLENREERYPPRTDLLGNREKTVRSTILAEPIGAHFEGSNRLNFNYEGQYPENGFLMIENRQISEISC